MRQRSAGNTSSYANMQSGNATEYPAVEPVMTVRDIIKGSDLNEP
jgi:hypothetical protein